MSIEEREEERRYEEAAAAEGARALFEQPMRRFRLPAPVVVAAGDTVAAVVRRMVGAQQACAVVAGAGGEVSGIFTERDLLVRVVAQGADPARTPVGTVMTPDPECVTREDTLGFALHKMVVGRYRTVPVVDEERRPRGVLTQQDGVKALAALFPAAVLNQPPRSFEQQPPRNRYGG